MYSHALAALKKKKKFRIICSTCRIEEIFNIPSVLCSWEAAALSLATTKCRVYADLLIKAQIILMSFTEHNSPHIPGCGEVWIQQQQRTRGIYQL